MPLTCAIPLRKGESILNRYALQQFEYHAWANRKVCEHLEGLTEEVYRKEVQSVFPTIYDTMVHIYVIDRGWLEFFESSGVTDTSPEYYEQLKNKVDAIVAETRGKHIEELSLMQDELAGQFRKFIEGHENLEAYFPSGGFQARGVDFLQHMVNHGTYHRGNITAMLRQLGYPGTPTDYGYYLYILSQ